MKNYTNQEIINLVGDYIIESALVALQDNDSKAVNSWNEDINEAIENSERLEIPATLSNNGQTRLITI